MKVVALVSGGKDSTFNMLECVRNGHQIVALAHLHPDPSTDQDELDSFMYQTVGFHGVEYIAKAMDLPLFQQTIQGTAVSQDLTYTATENDEVEDLYQILTKVKQSMPEIEAVASGAILSNYQRTRVENVCTRLGLVSLCYLWQRNQKQLLDSMIDSGIEAILVKTAVMGLEPRQHLGKSISQLQPHFLSLEKSFGMNVCGEGGEYETFTLDCPLFKKKIVVKESQILGEALNDPTMPVGHLRLSALELVDKPDFEPFAPPTEQKSDENSPPVSNLAETPFPTVQWPAKATQANQIQTVSRVGSLAFVSTEIRHNANVGVDTNPEECIQALFSSLEAQLKTLDATFANIIYVHLFISDMTQFGPINEVYKTKFGVNPPSRCCVQLDSLGCPARFDCLVFLGPPSERHVLHVQSISRWAPSNIGPYSQATRIGPVAFLAGQIALDPASLKILQSQDPISQTRLSWQHARSVAQAVQRPHTMSAFIYCAAPSRPRSLISTETQSILHDSPATFDACLFVEVPVLPRKALVEVQAITCDHSTALTISQGENPDVGLAVSATLSSIESVPVVTTAASVFVAARVPPANETFDLDSFVQFVGSFVDGECKQNSLSVVSARCFYIAQQDNSPEDALADAFGRCLNSSVSMVPVSGLCIGKMDACIVIHAFCSQP